MNKKNKLKECFKEKILDKIKEKLKDKLPSKIEICKLLGAEEFQKVVFKVEEIKYKTIDKLFPNANKKYEHLVDKYYQRRLKKGKNVDEVKIKRDAQLSKLRFKKELITKQNRNYHPDPQFPLLFVEYLKKNKEIHVKGLYGNLGATIAIIVASIIFPNIPIIAIISLLGLQAIGAFINFECINLQNYNLCRYEEERLKSLLTSQQKRKLSKNIKEFGECSKVISRTLTEDIELPSLNKTVNELENIQQTQELKVLATRRLQTLQKQSKKLELRRD